MAGAYYNENDPYAADWLENLIAGGHIAAGRVDRRSIKYVKPRDLHGYDQCHFFAGAGGWSLALRMAGWDDARQVWTGSCPCQPFSKSGRRRGFDDERHMWPHWFRLIRECRPATIFGEQVAGAGQWIDKLFADLESLDYACGAADLPAACAGSPQARQRLWFVADASRRWREGGAGLCKNWSEPYRDQLTYSTWWDAEPDVARVADGLPGAVDQRRVFGNAIVPQVAAEFVRAFAEARR